MGIPAIVTAGDGDAARAVRGQSKVFLEIAGRPLVARVVSVLQQVPEISEVWVVGDVKRLEHVFSQPDVRAELLKPLHLVEQFRHLYENCWEAYRRLLPGAGPDGRDPEEADRDLQPLFLSADLPFATPQEISSFIRKGWAVGCDFGVGMVSEQLLRPFLPERAGAPGIQAAYFNLREARLRQSNLFLVKPGRIGNRNYVEELYEHRHQREFRDMLGLAWRILRSRQGGLSALFFYGLVHMAGAADRAGWRWLADRLRPLVSVGRVESIISRLLDTNFRFIAADVGGCAVDIDTDREYDVVLARFDEWSSAQHALAESLHGPLPLPPRVGRASE